MVQRNNTITSITNIKFKYEQYPYVFQITENNSIIAQKRYFLFNRIYIYLLVLGSMLSASIIILEESYKIILLATIALIFIIGLFILWITRARQYDKIWFDSRAIAESVKTVSWRFMMFVKPFQKSKLSDQIFSTKLSEIRKARFINLRLLSCPLKAKSKAITDMMHFVRSRSFHERKNFYLKERLLDQKEWYLNKAKWNSDCGKRWFNMTICLQLLCIIISIIQIIIKIVPFNILPILTTCIAAIGSWSQMKQHDELAITYTNAAQELIELEAAANNIAKSTDFSEFVEQVEETISREHVMWRARREAV